jgi:multiple sugar transport system permease protein
MPAGTSVEGFQIPSFTTLANYQFVVGGANAIWLPLSHSAIVSVAATGIAMVLATPAAYGLSRLRRRRVAQATYLLFFVLRGVPPITLVIPYYLLLSQANMLDSLQGLTLALVPLALPFAVWTLRVFFDAVPEELEDAARVDGANAFQRFALVIVPTVRQGLAVTSILAALLVFVDYIFALTITGPNSMTYAIYVTGFKQDYVTLFGPLAAATLIGAVPMVVMYSLSQRYMQRLAMAGIH